MKGTFSLDRSGKPAVRCSSITKASLALSVALWASSASAGIYSGASASIKNDLGGCDVNSGGTQPATATASCDIGFATLSVDDLTIKSFLDLRGDTGVGRTTGTVSDAFFWDPLTGDITVSLTVNLEGETTAPYGPGYGFGLNYSLNILVIRPSDGAVIPMTGLNGNMSTMFTIEGTIDPNTGLRLIDGTVMRDLLVPTGAVGVVFSMGHQSEIVSNGLADFAHTAGFQLTVPNELASSVTRDSGFQFVNGGEPIGSVPAPATILLFGLGLSALGWSRRKKA